MTTRPKVLSRFPKKIGRTLLLFVHRTYILLRCGKPLAADAHFGRFLPRLGPLVATQEASFLVYFPLSLFTADLSFACKLDAGDIRSECWDQLFQLSQYQRRQKRSGQGHKPQSRDLERPAK